MFINRQEAGIRLANRLLHTPTIQAVSPSNLLVLSIPRGGVIIGQAVAQALHCDHQVLIVKKVGFPGAEELAIGAIAEDDIMVLNHAMLAWNGLSLRDIQPEIEQAKAKVARYVRLFRQDMLLHVREKTVILVDDGIATGESIKAAIQWMKSRPAGEEAKRVIVAAPVCSPETFRKLTKTVDEIICLLTPDHFHAVGPFYRDFAQVEDSEVLEILAHRERQAE